LFHHLESSEVWSGVHLSPEIMLASRSLHLAAE
jgi:hypothetical protein